MKNFIPLNVHNVLDYVGGILLMLLPTLFGFSDVQDAQTFCLIMGVGLIAYSAITNYRYSLLKVIPLGAHMTLDVLAGALVAVAPWFLGYRAFLAPGAAWAHVVAGVGLIAVVAFTRPLTEEDRIAGGTEAPESFEPREKFRRVA